MASRRPDLHLGGVERRVGAGPRAGGPVADAVGAVFLEQRHRRDDVPLRLRHLLALGIEDPAGERGVGPRQRAVLEVRAQHGREQPRPDDVVRLRPQVHREDAREQIRIVEPSARNLRRQRRGRPGVHDVGIAGEPVRRVALIRRVAIGEVGGRIDRQARFVRRERPAVIDAAVGAHRIPHRERHAEEALPADAPVAGQAVHPVLVAVPHVLGMPLQLAAARQQRVAELHRLDEPLAARDDLERPVALLVELHRMRDGPRLADQIARLAKLLDDRRPRLRRREVRRADRRPAARARHHAIPIRRRPISAGGTRRWAESPRAPAARARATTSRR